MSQAAEEMFKTLGLTAVSVENPNTVKTTRTENVAPRRKFTALTVIAMIGLGVGFKFIGDYAADTAIDAWAARASAPYTVADPETLKMFERMHAEELAEDAAAQPAEPLSLGTSSESTGQ